MTNAFLFNLSLSKDGAAKRAFPPKRIIPVLTISEESRLVKRLGFNLKSALGSGLILKIPEREHNKNPRSNGHSQRGELISFVGARDENVGRCEGPTSQPSYKFNLYERCDFHILLRAPYSRSSKLRVGLGCRRRF